MKSKLGIFTLLIVLAAALSGCGKGAGYPSESELQKATPPGASAATGDTGASDTADSGKVGKPPKVSGSLSKKPVIATPKDNPPSKLIIKDIKKGTGKKAADGDKLSMQYVGINWDDGKQFDASWDRHQAFSFVLGKGAVIQGWDKGIVGMRVGGRRELVIPPDLGYGAQGSGSIPANETLVFVVDLKKVS